MTHPTRTRWAIAAMFLLNAFIFASWVPHIPAVKDRHLLSTGELGMLLLAMAAGALCALPFAGAIVSRFGSRVTTIASAYAFAVLLLAPVIAPSAALAAVALFLFGGVNAIMDVAMNAQGAELEQHMAKPIMSSLHGFWSLGGLAGSGLAGVLLQVGLSPTLHVLMVAAMTAAGFVVAAQWLFRSRPTHSSDRPMLVLPSRALLGLGVMTFAALLIEGAIADWSAVYLRDVRRLDAGGAAMGYAAFSLTMAACRFAGDRLVHRSGPNVIVRTSATVALIGMAVVLLAPEPTLAILGFGLVGLGMANIIPLLFSAAARMRPDDPGTGIAAVATTGYVGHLAGPPVIGLLAELVGLSGALGLLIVLCAYIAVFSSMLRLRAVKR